MRMIVFVSLMCLAGCLADPEEPGIDDDATVEVESHATLPPYALTGTLRSRPTAPAPYRDFDWLRHRRDPSLAIGTTRSVTVDFRTLDATAGYGCGNGSHFALAALATGASSHAGTNANQGLPIFWQGIGAMVGRTASGAVVGIEIWDGGENNAHVPLSKPVPTGLVDYTPYRLTINVTRASSTTANVTLRLYELVQGFAFERVYLSRWNLQVPPAIFTTPDVYSGWAGIPCRPELAAHALAAVTLR